MAYLTTSIFAADGLKLNKTVKQIMFHWSSELIFDALVSRSLLWIYAKSRTFVLHPAFEHYTTDFPEENRLSYTMISIKTAMPCTGCVVGKGASSTTQ